MKYVIVLIVASASAFAQKVTLAEQKACYTQARQYVSDYNKGNKGGVPWILAQAHYEANSRTCYAKVTFSQFYPDSKEVVSGVDIVDAYEAKTIGTCSFSTKEPVKTYITCWLGNDTASTKDEWQGLLRKTIPAFAQ